MSDDKHGILTYWRYFQESLSTLFSLYIREVGFGESNIDAGWLGRQGIALALHSVADVLRTKDLPVVMTFLISRALVISNSLLPQGPFLSQYMIVFWRTI